MEYGEGTYVTFGDLPSGVTVGDTDTMVVTINDNDGPIRTPGPPQDLRADAGDGQVALSWLSPADTGAAAIQRYEYRHAKASELYTLDWKTAAGGADARSVTVADLDNGTEYKFEVEAVNRFGAGEEAEVTATPAVPSVLAIGDVTVDEGDGTAVLEVTLTPASTETVTVDYATADATATEGEDYTAANGTLTFAMGVTSREISIAITDDADDEDAETLTVTLSGATNATIGDGTGQVTIENDDELPGPPQDLSADPDDGEVTLSWSPPASSGSAAITGYEFRYAEGSDAYADTWNDVSGGDAAAEVTVGSLTNGASHRFQVRAVSDVGGASPRRRRQLLFLRRLCRSGTYRLPKEERRSWR